MKLTTSNIDNFIQNISKERTNGVLIYGEDFSLINIRKKEIIKRILPDYKSNGRVNIIEIMFKEDLNILYNEYNSYSLFSKKVIVVDFVNNNLLKSLRDIFNKQQNNNNFIIITSAELNSQSTIVKFVENNSYITTIPCYKDDIDSIKRLITGKLKENNFKYNSEILDYLSNLFGGDRAIILNELEKLFIYKN